MKVKIRGIYSTALSKLLKENGFQLTNTSEAINERLDLESSADTADPLIYDKDDLNGITVSGTSAEEIISLLNKKFFDISVKRNETGAVYCGKIKNIDSKSKKIWVDLGDGQEGVLSLQNYWGFLREGEKVLVQIKSSVHGTKLLSTQLRLFGENMILIKNGFTKTSSHIRSRKERQRLESISEKIKLNDWGILWKSLAEGKPDEELVAEINQLLDEEKKIKQKFEQANEPGVIQEGLKVYFVDFGAKAKSELDSIRRNVLTTIVGHHFLKSGGYALLTDFAESLNDLDEQIVKNRMNLVLESKGPQPGQRYKIIHKKPGNKDVHFNGKVKAIGDTITVRRELRAGGRFDGLGGKIEDGDYSLTQFRPGSWTLTHKYFNSNGNLKGTYTNINTPIEVYPDFARYIDLEIDVVEKDGKREIIDLEKLEGIKKAGIINEELAQKALDIANNIMKGELNEK